MHQQRFADKHLKNNMIDIIARHRSLPPTVFRPAGRLFKSACKNRILRYILGLH